MKLEKYNCRPIYIYICTEGCKKYCQTFYYPTMASMRVLIHISCICERGDRKTVVRCRGGRETVCRGAVGGAQWGGKRCGGGREAVNIQAVCFF